MANPIQIELFKEGAKYKVRSTWYEEIHESTFDYSGFHRKFIGFSDKTALKTTCGRMTLTEANDFVKHITEECRGYAGWYEIIEVTNAD